MSKNVLFYFTASYPFDKGEQFIVDEIFELSIYYDEVVLFPASNKNDIARAIPGNAKVSSLIYSRMHKHDISVRKHLKLMISVLLLELFNSGSFGYVFKTMRTQLSYLKQAVGIGNSIQEVASEYKGDTISYYSSWMDLNTLSLALLKKQNIINQFSFKMRGFDLFDERRTGGYMPFRYFNFKQAHKALTMSKKS